MIEAAILVPIYVTISGENEQLYFLLGSPSEKGMEVESSENGTSIVLKQSQEFFLQFRPWPVPRQEADLWPCPYNCFYFTTVHCGECMNHYKHKYDCSLPPTSGLAYVLQPLENCV